MKIYFISLLIVISALGCASAPKPEFKPAAEQDASTLYADLFQRVQMGGIFSDSKTFVDMIPQSDPGTINRAFTNQRPTTKTDLTKFVENHFLPPKVAGANYLPNPKESIEVHIRKLWQHLKRDADNAGRETDSLIRLPYSYVVPGGRFREIYYWDSYFTQLGLLSDGEIELFRNTVKNFEYLLNVAGRIPNGNRDYYRSRSQPPFFSHMVALWQAQFGRGEGKRFLPALKREHAFWMSGARQVTVEGGLLNRYWDDLDTPRPESYAEDVHLASEAHSHLGRPKESTYRSLRAGAESGWDFSTRWFKDPNQFITIDTTAYAPVDLNALLYHLEMKIAELSGDAHFADLAAKRKELMQKLMWDPQRGTFQDFNLTTNTRSPEMTLAMAVPLFTGVATEPQAKSVAKVLEAHFLKAGGLVTTLRESKQQWDAPNGWAPLQWMAYSGLKRYGQNALAEKVRMRWLDLNRRVYRSTGKLMEKYNVVDPSLKSGGGEYPLQDGFGWTNGVYRALSSPDRFLSL